MYAKPSVFNKFTFKNEDVINMFQLVLADKLHEPEQYIFYGFLTSLIPPRPKGDLKVVVVDTRKNRINQAIRQGLSEEVAKNGIDTHDARACDWTNFLYNKDACDSSLYDLVIAAENRGHRQITKNIMNFHLKRDLTHSIALKKSTHTPSIIT